MGSPIRVAVADDYEIVVAGIAGILLPYADRVLVVELDSQLPVQQEVDVVLYDTFGQPQGDAMDLDSLALVGSPRVIVFSWNADPGLRQQALSAGASGYVHKSVSGLGLVEAIERVHAGETVLPTEVEETDDFGHWPGQREGLSAREAEVLALICQGFSNDDITQRAFIGLNTLKTHIRSLYAKIDVDSRTRAVLWGVDHGFRPDQVRVHLEPRDP